MKRWTRQELCLLGTYENLTEEYAATPDIVKDCITMQKILILEAKLLAINKPVIGYVENTLEGIFDFNEAQAKAEYYIKRGKIFLHHPINFKTMREYASFLNQVAI